ncbi:MAG: NAD(P)/FAD-dependent oxidoreductase [Tepidisphaeraceae bacterium]|jgi:C-3',4' desaturase CrtD
MYDIAIVGGGMAGMATAARLQARGLSTVVLESHTLPGGCAGFYRRKGFSFDVGATTLVDFEADGIGGRFLQSIGVESFNADPLPGYVAWLPDRCVVLHKDVAAWHTERLHMLGDSLRHQKFWHIMDTLAAVFWRAARRGARLPVRDPLDALRAIRSVGLTHLHWGRYLQWTMGDLLRAYGLRADRPLVGLLSMLIEDTVHGTIDCAPLINSALGITIRGAGLTRARGGMRGFWKTLVDRYRALGGELRTRCAVERVENHGGGFTLHAESGKVVAHQVVSAVPASITARIAPRAVVECLAPYVRRDSQALGGAIVVCLGVEEAQVAGQTFTHHQLMHDYDRPLGDGNNMFISASAPGDLESAPAGYRSVMISTHCELCWWEGLSRDAYEEKKRVAGERLIALARRVYPRLGESLRVLEVATPRTYQHFTGSPRGAVGGVRQTLANANQHAIPHKSPLPGFWLVGDSTWPGLGTVACMIGSQIVADGAGARAKRSRPRVFLPRIIRHHQRDCPQNPRRAAAVEVARAN